MSRSEPITRRSAFREYVIVDRFDKKVTVLTLGEARLSGASPDLADIYDRRSCRGSRSAWRRSCLDEPAQDRGRACGEPD